MSAGGRCSLHLQPLRMRLLFGFRFEIHALMRNDGDENPHCTGNPRYSSNCQECKNYTTDVCMKRTNAGACTLQFKTERVLRPYKQPHQVSCITIFLAHSWLFLSALPISRYDIPFAFRSFARVRFRSRVFTPRFLYIDYNLYHLLLLSTVDMLGR